MRGYALRFIKESKSRLFDCRFREVLLQCPPGQQGANDHKTRSQQHRSAGEIDLVIRPREKCEQVIHQRRSHNGSQAHQAGKPALQFALRIGRHLAGHDPLQCRAGSRIRCCGRGWR